MNKVLKSSDLIGWTKRIVTPDMVGAPVAVATVLEMKEEGWRYSANEHERAQLAFINLCVADGGIGKFCTGPHDMP